jgi:hypothetical protein
MDRDRKTDGRIGRQTDRREVANSCFRNFANVPKNKRSLVMCHNYNITILLIVLINYLILA